MLTTSEQIDELVRGPVKLIVALCPVCGGWTMFVASDSDNARDWIRQCYVAGDLILPMTGIGMGPMCPQVDFPTEERTCDQ